MINRSVDAIIALQAWENTMLPTLHQQLKECEKAIEAGLITPSTKRRLEARRKVLNIRILQEKLGKRKCTEEQIVGWSERFKDGDPNDLKYQKQIIDVFVNSIYVFVDKQVMSYNDKDESETISLKDVQQAFGWLLPVVLHQHRKSARVSDFLLFRKSAPLLPS